MINLKNLNQREVFDAFVGEIQEKQFAEIALPVSEEVFRDAADVFLDFLTLDQVTKNSLYRVHPVNPRDSGIGYVRKAKQENYSDAKEYVHYLPIAHEYFKEEIAHGDPRIGAFFNMARDMHSQIVPVMEDILKMLTLEFPDIYDRFFPDEFENPRTPLRFLKYDVQGKGEFLARGHYDMAGCTLALAESAPGLRIGKNEETLKPVTRKGGGAIFMPARNFPKMTDERFTPAWHDVVQSAHARLSDTAARLAIVLFIAQKDLPLSSFEETHKPLS